jgi:hypothetical protein
VTKGIPLDREGPTFQSAPDQAPRTAAAAPTEAPAPARESAGTSDLVAGLLSATTAIGGPELMSDDTVPIDLPRLDPASLLRTDLLRDRLTAGP